jgi:squalene-hopene/tetraprenyl-beta-curcumene cyclase
MIVYRGVLHNSHLYAVVRAALRAHGFARSAAEYYAAEQEQWQLGCWLRDWALPERLAGFVSSADYERIAATDAPLWNQFPLMAGLGFRQARVLSGLLPASPTLGNAVALLGAVFNTGIALFDYLVDESPVGAGLFELLNRDLVRGIFEPGVDTRANLARASQQVSDPRLRLLLGLVAAFATLGQELRRRGGNRAAWAGLGRLVVALFEAERAVSLRAAPPDRARDLLPALETKSALPSRTLLQIALLAAPPLAEPPPRAHRAAATLGRIFWRIDDLADLLTDCRRGAASALLLRLGDRLAEQGRAWASDADLYDEAEATAEELVGLLESGAFGPTGPAPAAADPALSAVLQLARSTVAGWARWHEDAGALSEESPKPRRSVGDHGSARAAVEMLLTQQRDGYREAIHPLCFPRAYGKERCYYETHPALLWQRAVVLDSLLDARAAGLPVPRRVLDAEALTILRLKHRDVRGGWSYLPEVPELPPDADDLGQVLQVLCRLGGPALAFTCEEGVRLALDAAEPHGGFPTWIFDPRGRSPADRRVRGYPNVIGGLGMHPEVVANLLQGVLLYDPTRYRQALLRAVPYLESVQEERGAWPSHWYAGPYYGTYRVAAVLGAVTPGSTALRRARAFLRGDQRADGSWGAAAGEPLSTALAVLALTAPGMDTDEAAVGRGLAYLSATQQADGGWPACPCISFQTLDGVETYGSRTITTAFSLKAFATRPDRTGFPPP